MTTVRFVEIRPDVQRVQLTSHSSNKSFGFLCLDCIAKKMTNKQYRAILVLPYISQLRRCANCGAMTIDMAKSQFGLSIGQIIKASEERTIYKDIIFGLPHKLTIEPNYLKQLKGLPTNG